MAAKVAVVYHSYRGVTIKLVQALVAGVLKGGGDVSCKSVSEASIADLASADAFVLASGQPFGSLAGPMKAFVESCWNSPERARLEGKPFSYIVNGSNDPTQSGAFMEKIGKYFRWELAAKGVATPSSAVDQAMENARELGATLASCGHA